MLLCSFVFVCLPSIQPLVDYDFRVINSHMKAFCFLIANMHECMYACMYMHHIADILCKVIICANYASCRGLADFNSIGLL